MALSYEEAEEIKNQLLKQLGKFPEESRDLIKEKVKEMPASEVEEFVKDNNLTHLGNQCIFCTIVAGKIPSFKIAENSENMAILEINPLSKGHTLIVPKSHLEKLPSSSETLAKEIGKLIAEKLSPKEVHVQESKIMEHPVLEVVPLYGNESKRYQATEEELKSIQEKLLKPKEEVEKVIEKPEEIIPKEELSKPLYKLPPRIP